jgi:hypothetical protein
MQYVEAIRRQVVLRLVSGVAECCFFVCRIVVGTSYRIAASAARCVPTAKNDSNVLDLLDKIRILVNP